jgi:quercetin dioxygenase-like cupin family protein
MKRLHPHQAAATAVAAHPDRPATAVLLDSPDARLVVFRIEPGQEVATHHSPSTVILAVLQGTGTLTGGDGECQVSAGDVVAYEPGEQHSMRAGGETLTLLATITPRPGTREAPTREAPVAVQARP